MVSMGPSIQNYDFTHRWVDLCKLDSCRNKPLKKPEIRTGSLLGILSSKKEFSKIRKIIDMAGLDEFFISPSYYNKHTLFTTEDKNIPDSFMKSLDYDKARRFVNAYTLRGSAPIQYLLQNGDSIYTSCNESSPMLAMVEIKDRTPYDPAALHRTQQPIEILKGDITINKVGKVTGEIIADDGVIIVVDNMADL